MFDGVPHDQLHQFIAASSRAAPSLPLPLSSSFPLHYHNHSPQTAAFSNSNTFDILTYNSIPQNHHQLLFPLQQQQFLHPILQQSPGSKSGINEQIKEAHHEPAANTSLVDSANNIDLEIERDRPIHPHQPTSSPVDDPAWSNDEVLALLRIRSTMENWLPDFTWEHVSRKLSEIGFQRSGEKCKEKFEEESRYFNDNINNCTKASRFLCSSSSELEEEFYHHTQNQPPHHQNHSTNTDNIIVGTAHKSQIRLVLESPGHESAGFRGKKGGTSTTTTTADQTACLEDDDELGSPRSYNQDHQQTFDVAAKEAESDQVEERANTENHDSSTRLKSKKRKRRQKVKFEMFKGFCEEIVNKMMCQQEEMHNKLLEDMVKRDKEKVEKEEARKKQEMDKMNKELEIMAHEQAIAGDRQATIIEFLNMFISSPGTTTTTATTSSEFSDRSQFSQPKKGKNSLNKVECTNNHTNFSPTPSIQAALESPRPHRPTSHHDHENQNNTNNVKELPSSSSAMIVRRQSLSLSPESKVTEQSQQNPRAPTATSFSQNPNRNPITSSNPKSSITHKVTLQNPMSSINHIKEDVGKRWPRDEVLALINLRCSLYNSGADQDHHNKEKEGGGGTCGNTCSTVKAPLWERISQGMSELGYKRSAKRCKEKWENINKYFRKTKNVNKKRSVESRTCPYFHQLSTLYNKGTLVAPNNSEQGLQEINHHSSDQLGSLPHDHHDHQYDIDHHRSSDVHVAAEDERSDNINVVVHHQEVVPAAFDLEF